MNEEATRALVEDLRKADFSETTVEHVSAAHGVFITGDSGSWSMTTVDARMECVALDADRIYMKVIPFEGEPREWILDRITGEAARINI
ncbi:hypothetical protein [Agromyces aerolatus]|uniref:hypothetical protein n=1 Tax=Agromyces sp. LY-1074 TaxID=3074080 RepID=UPI002858449E|nr:MULTISPECIES: hypothetical protein [unclassified Agromyces]MDR5699963.1 hypothetical protein [Agromyces sp. LY-1074]MDR5706225.1 hypothetical protein [Agromyces sp. LY-1358]